MLFLFLYIVFVVLILITHIRYLTDDSFVDDLLKQQKSGTLEVEINFAWVGINRKGDYNAPHIHPYADVSGVYYVSMSQAAANLYHLDPRPGAQALGMIFEEKYDALCCRIFFRTHLFQKMFFYIHMLSHLENLTVKKYVDLQLFDL